MDEKLCGFPIASAKEHPPAIAMSLPLFDFPTFITVRRARNRSAGSRLWTEQENRQALAKNARKRHWAGHHVRLTKPHSQAWLFYCFSLTLQRFWTNKPAR
jgi:hypothetical protein